MKKNTASRTIYYYGRTVLKHWPFFFLGILTSFGYTYCLTFLNAQAVSKIIDQVSEGNVAKEKVLITFLPAIILLVMANVVGQICSKLQDYAVWKLEILGYYDLSTLVFDSLSNQSMTFITVGLEEPWSVRPANLPMLSPPWWNCLTIRWYL